ncbi:MAG: hypothetical protein CL933_11300 [Deltaproteobacteria bacterium]|nr:hypothetical protein [Deltaproteobacteria bacterium]
MNSLIFPVVAPNRATGSGKGSFPTAVAVQQNYSHTDDDSQRGWHRVVGAVQFSGRIDVFFGGGIREKRGPTRAQPKSK